LIDRFLAEYNPVVRVIEHYTMDEDIEYLNVRIYIPRAYTLVVIREYWQGRNLVAYGYYLRTYDYEEWWDNRPHHPEVQTQPHHRHSRGEVHPLQNPSIEEFLINVKQLLHKHPA